MRKPNRNLIEQILGIGSYAYLHGQLYFIHGNCRIKVTEHFPTDGRPLDLLLEDVIQFSAQQQDNEVRQNC